MNGHREDLEKTEFVVGDQTLVRPRYAVEAGYQRRGRRIQLRALAAPCILAVVSQAFGDVAFTSVYATDFSDTPEGARSAGAVATADNSPVIRGPEEELGRQE